jgi:hypothetical protein
VKRGRRKEGGRLVSDSLELLRVGDFDLDAHPQAPLLQTKVQQRDLCIADNTGHAWRKRKKGEE